MKAVVSLMTLFGLLVTGCAVPQAGYRPQNLDMGELALGRRGVVMQGTANHGLRGLSMDRLAKVVVCVPDAVAYMDSAQSLRTTGQVMKYTGWAVFAASLGAVVYSIMNDDGRYLRPALIAGSSSWILTEAPRVLAPFAIMKTVDAAHAFEDQRLFLPACGGQARLPNAAPAPSQPPNEVGPGGARF
jgi:hypothetical protein